MDSERAAAERAKVAEWATRQRERDEGLSPAWTTSDVNSPGFGKRLDEVMGGPVPQTAYGINAGLAGTTPPPQVFRSDYDRIRMTPTSIDTRSGEWRGCAGVHESVLRAYQILEKVKELLSKGVPGDVVRELIEFMEVKP